MPPPSIDREALIAALAEQARSDAPTGPEPEPEELLDYLSGRLAPEEARRIERLLVAHPDAARALLDLADLEEAGATAGERPAELETRAGWRDLQTQLPDAVPRPRRATPWLPAVAAALLVATAGLSAWVWRLQSELDRPIANLQSLELPSGSRASAERVVELAPGAPLRLVLAPAERCPVYAAELEGPGRGDHRTIERLERDEQGRLVLLWRLEPGAYGLRLTGCEPRRELEVHRFRVTAKGG